MGASMAAPGGTVTFVGGCARDASVTIPAHRLHYDEVTLRGSYHHTPGHIARALDMLTQESIPWDALVGPAVGLDVLPSLLAGGSPSCTGHLKQLIDPSC
jgi:L-iditol 2-dehydrogenase